MTATSLESSVLDNISEQILVLPTGDILPITAPELRRSSGKYLSMRGLRLTNAIIRKGILQVAGSPWLPGFWNLSAGKAEMALEAFKAQGETCTLFLSFTDSPVNSKGWHSYKGDPYMVLPVSWSSFDEYVASMKKKYRARLRKVQKSNQGLRIEILSQEGPQFGQCVAMLEATLRDKVVALPDNLEYLLGMFKRCFGASFKTFGFYLVNLDIREESTNHSNAISEILKKHNNTDYDQLDESSRISSLENVIKSELTLDDIYPSLSDETKKVLDVFTVMKELRNEVSEHAFGNYVISMTHHASHVFEVLEFLQM